MDANFVGEGPIRYVVGSRMIDCTGSAPVQDPVVVVQGTRIKEVGTRTSIRIPDGADVLDCGSATLIPGMLDVHIHTMMFNCLTFHNLRVAQ